MKKAVSVGTSAALLASLFATAIAPSAFASTSVTSAGTVPRGGTSANAASFTFTENSAAAFPAGGGTLTVTILDSAGNATVHFTGTATLTAPGSLGASVAVGDNSFTVTATASDTANVEQITVGGLKIKADIGAATGAIKATLTGSLAGDVLSSTTTATGTLQTSVAAGATSVAINVTSACSFAVTGGSNGQLTWATISDSVNVTVAPAPVAGVQTLTVAALTAAHTAGEAVSQTVANCSAALGSPGTVADVVVQNTGIPANVNPGEQNQPATATSITELTAGYIPVGTLTFTLSATGVQFSAPPTVAVTGFQQTVTVAALTNAHLAGSAITQTHTGCTSTGTLDANVAAAATSIVVDVTSPACPFTATSATDSNIFIASDGTNAAENQAASAATNSVANGSLTLGSNVCTLSFDRMSCSVPVTAVSTTPVTITLSNIKLDVASTVANGTAVNVVVSSTPAINVLVNANTIANVARVIVGTAAQPTIFINYNDQSTGLITLTEAGAGFFQGGTGTNNVITVCILTGETFTRAPYAVVTAGDLKLLSGVVGGTSVLGTLNAGGTCASWTVYTASTVASTIEIRGSDASGAVLPSAPTNGPRVSVPGTLHPGTTQMEVFTGNGSTIQAPLGLVSNAVRAFKSGIVVAAVSQPTILAGSPDSLVGNITITETLNGQFKPGETICVVILPRTSNGLLIQDTTLKSATTNDLPVISTNSASGLLASQVGAPGCANVGLAIAATPTITNSFSFMITQQSFGPTLGQITISNIHVITTADAPKGAVLMDVAGNGGAFGGVQFETTISNAKIGVAGVADAWIAKGGGVRTASAFGLGTVVVKRGALVTVRGKSSSVGPGGLVQIWVKTKTTAWHKESSRRVSTDGFMYYSAKVLNLGYRYYKLVFVDDGTSNVVRAFGK